MRVSKRFLFFPGSRVGPAGLLGTAQADGGLKCGLPLGQAKKCLLALSRLADGLALAIKLPLRAVHGDSQQQNSCVFCTGCGRLGSNGVVEKNRPLETAGFVTARRTRVKYPRDVQVPVGQFDQAHDLM